MIHGFDVETDRLDPYAPGARLLTVALGAHAWPVAHPDLATEEWRGLKGGVPAVAKAVLGNPKRTIVGHNLAFDVCWIEKAAGFRVEAKLFDTMVAQYRLDENAENNLEAVAQRWLGEGKLEGLDRRKLAEEPLALVLKYNLRDAQLAKRLHEHLFHALDQEGLLPLFERDMRLLRILVDMRHHGFRLDWKRLAKVGRETDAAIEKLEKSLRRRAGRPDLNFRSPKQLDALFYTQDGFDLPVVKRSKKTAAPAADREALALLTTEPGISTRTRRWLVDFGEVKKLLSRRSGFVAKWPAHRGVDDRVHATLHLGRAAVERRGAGTREAAHGTVTGRLSCSEPNLQNVPKRDTVLRPCFVPAKGWKLAKGDYSQIELRVAGWLSGDEAMRGIFAAGQDFHTATLATLEGVDYGEAIERVKKDPKWRTKRDACKRVNFGAIYGAFPQRIWRVARTDGFAVTLEEIQAVWEGQREVFAGFWKWVDNVHKILARDGQVVSPFGVVRRLPDAHDRDWWVRKEAERQAVNHLVQNGAAEILFRALEEMTRDDIEGIRPVLTVHDEIVVEYRGWRKAPIEAWMHARMVTAVNDRMHRDRLPELDHLYLAAEVEAGLSAWSSAGEE